MRVAMGSDHAGFELKEALRGYLNDLKYDVLDLGTHSPAPVDYPDYAEAVGVAVRRGKADRGIMVCGSGVGASIAANKVPGIRAGLCHDTYSAHQGVEHDDMNVLVLGVLVIGRALARELVGAYLRASFTCEERNQLRLEKVRALERGDGDRHPDPVTGNPHYVPFSYEAVLFDMDGVISDTARIHAQCWKTIFDEYLQKRRNQ